MTKVIFLVLFLILVLLLILHYYFAGDIQTLNLFLQIFGGFIATLFGVYISLYLTNKEEEKKSKNIRQKKFIETLKIINSELHFNNSIYRLFIKILSKKYFHSTFITYDFQDIEPSLYEITDKAYYSAISSGDFKEISADLNLLNVITSAYSNMLMTRNALRLTIQYFKSDNTGSDPEPQNELDNAIKELNMFLKTVRTQISINKKAIKRIEEALWSYGIGHKAY